MMAWMLTFTKESMGMAVAKSGHWSRLTGCIVIPLRLEACLEAFASKSVRSSRLHGNG